MPVDEKKIIESETPRKEKVDGPSEEITAETSIQNKEERPENPEVEKDLKNGTVDNESNNAQDDGIKRTETMLDESANMQSNSAESS